MTLLILTQLGVAQERIGLLRVLSGSAQLNGVPVSRAALAREGQTLVLSEGSQVRISLLESNKEVILKNPGSHILHRDNLLRWARSTSRGGVDVATDLGSRQVAAGNTLRSAERKSLNPVLPPKPDSRGKYRAIEFQPEAPLKVEEGHAIELLVTELQSAGSRTLGGTTYESGARQELERLELQQELRAGVTYRLTLTSNDVASGDSSIREIDFRILTPEEETFLSAAVEKLDTPQADRRTLWKLADIYSSLGQPFRLLQTLQKIEESYETVPPQNDEETNEELMLPIRVKNLESNVYLEAPGLQERGK